MPETNAASQAHKVRIRRRGRLEQIRIYLGKFIRMFIYQSDWKVMPMAMVIAAVVGMVVKNTMFRNMENTLLGAFAMSCVCIWNGCFNSIQVVCRERGIVKREHRSGMHITSYMAAHMIYQAFLCLIQSGLTTYVLVFIGTHFPEKGYVTSWSTVDFTIAVFLITYAADMLGLLVSCLVRSTTLAMTIVPFLLIFQLVFSGGFFSLPAWSAPLKNITISRYGLRSICALADYNELPSVAAWNTLFKMRDTTVEKAITVEEVRNFLKSDFVQDQLRQEEIDEGLTLDQAINPWLDDPMVTQYDAEAVNLRFTVGDVINVIGEENARNYILNASTAAGYQPDYDQNADNLIECWGLLIAFSLLYAGLSVICLEFIDRDKR
ncbi:MAG: ABC transporter permease [Oscillospiraceae bacterium]|nr:ABC transporter permease [Oscillospiraceae bacterium]